MGRIIRRGLVEGSASLEVHFEVSKVHPISSQHSSHFIPLALPHACGSDMSTTAKHHTCLPAAMFPAIMVIDFNPLEQDAGDSKSGLRLNDKGLTEPFL